MPDLREAVIHSAAYAAVRRLLENEAENAQALAFGLGVDVAEAELNRGNLTDTDAALFARNNELVAIRGLVSDTRNELRRVIEEGVREGLNERDLIPRIRDVIDAQEWRLQAIARTEMNRAANWGRFAAWKKSNVVTGKRFVATHDSRVRETHLAADGEVVPLNDTFTRGAAAGRLSPPVGVNCRCTMVPVTRDAAGVSDELRRRRGDSLEEARRRFEADNFERHRALRIEHGLKDPVTGGPVQVRERRLEGRDTGLSAERSNQRPTGGDDAGPLADAPADLVGLAPAAVRREIPGLRKVEDDHARRMKKAWKQLGRRIVRDANVPMPQAVSA